MGDRKGENRDSPPSFRAIGFADAQDRNNKAILAVLSGNRWNNKLDFFIQLGRITSFH